MTRAVPYFALIGLTPLTFMAAILADFLGWKNTLLTFFMIDLEQSLEILPQFLSFSQTMYPILPQITSYNSLITLEQFLGMGFIMLIIGHPLELVLLHRAFHKVNLWKRLPLY